MSWRWMLCGVGLSAASSIAVLGCAQGQDGIDLGSGSVTDPDGGSGPDGSRIPPGDGGGRADGSDPPDGSKPDDCPKPSGCTEKLVINELQVNGPSNAEFVELYNPNDCQVSLSGWKLLYRSSGDNPGGAPLYTFKSGDSIAAGDFFVLGNDNFQGPKQGPLGTSMGNSGGQLGLVDGANKVVDAVGYSSGTSGLYTEGSPAPNPETGSIARKCGVDTDDNSADFKAYPQHSAGAPNP